MVWLNDCLWYGMERLFWNRRYHHDELIGCYGLPCPGFFLGKLNSFLNNTRELKVYLQLETVTYPLFPISQSPLSYHVRGKDIERIIIDVGRSRLTTPKRRKNKMKPGGMDGLIKKEFHSFE